MDWDLLPQFYYNLCPGLLMDEARKEPKLNKDLIKIIEELFLPIEE